MQINQANRWWFDERLDLYIKLRYVNITSFESVHCNTFCVNTVHNYQLIGFLMT
jgi:hypothetical protein